MIILLNKLNNKEIKIKKNNISIYVCGPTVYDDVHIGNVRTFMSYDLLIKALKMLNFSIKYFQCITDIDDKIVNKSITSNKSVKNIVEKYTKNYFNILKTLNISLPIKFLKVSEHIYGIKKFILSLYKNNFAYIKNDDILFNIKKIFSKYYKLSKQKINKLKDDKNIDFCLWKNIENKPNWFFSLLNNYGRPGWHTECAFFINKYFDLPLDIHGGGIDLIFPHHENERIQLYSINKKEPVKIWTYIGTLLIDNKKMSKSLNNMIYMKDFLKRYDQNVFRYICLQSNFSKPLNYNEQIELNAEKIIQKWKKIKKIYEKELKNFNISTSINKENFFWKKIKFEILNNFNTIKICFWIEQCLKEIKKNKKNNETKFLKENFTIFLNIIKFLGFYI